MKLDPEYIPERVFMDYCPWCDEETPIEIVDEKPGHEPTGLLKSQLLECQNCETRWWI